MIIQQYGIKIYNVLCAEYYLKFFGGIYENS